MSTQDQGVMPIHARLRPLDEILGQCMIDGIEADTTLYDLGRSFDVTFTGPGAVITLDLHEGTFVGTLTAPAEAEGQLGTYGQGVSFTQDSVAPWMPAVCQFFFRDDPIPLNKNGEPYYLIKGAAHKLIEYTTQPPGTCIYCNGIHGSLTSECSRHKITLAQADAIRSGGLDFVNGKWVEL